MKKYLLALLTCISLCVRAQTDTNGIVSGPGKEAWDKVTDFLSRGSNYIFATYGIYDSGTHSWGGGVGVGYKLSDYVVPTIRVDYINSEIWMPSGSMQLQAPIDIGKSIRVSPFAFAGVATAVGGTGDNNGDAVGIYGVGLAVRVKEKFYVLGDWEQWSRWSGNQYRFGVGFHF